MTKVRHKMKIIKWSQIGTYNLRHQEAIEVKSIERLRLRWLDGVQQDLKEIGIGS